jgi:hypothetical protein
VKMQHRWDMKAIEKYGANNGCTSASKDETRTSDALRTSPATPGFMGSYEPAEFYTALTLATGMNAPTSPQPAPIKAPPGDDTEVLRTRRSKPHGPDNGQYNDQSRDNENSKLLCGCASKL